MRIYEELQKIYDSEINFVIIAEWDGGFRIKLGDEMNGFEVETTEDTLEKATIWLIGEVMSRYQDSLYVHTRIAIINKLREGFVDTDKFTSAFLNELIVNYEERNPYIRTEIKKKWLKEVDEELK